MTHVILNQEGFMPIMDLTYPAGALAAGRRTQLVDELTTVLLRAERAPDTDFFRNITWVYVHELPSEQLFAAGRPVSQPTFRLQVTVPQGALSDRRKAELVEQATGTICSAAELGQEDALRVWVLINEVPEGNWGAAGAIVRFEQLRRLAAAERDQPDAGGRERELVGVEHEQPGSAAVAR
jgi:phenylpyruvate tautomerase PptA (4-oxalocrotonate tautomerase family)